MEIKKNAPLLLGISIPILTILFVAGSVYLPGLFIKPRFDFLYASGGNYYGAREQYSIQNGKLVKSQRLEEIPLDRSPREEPRLFVHHVEKNESTELSFEEAQNLTLDSSAISPDGFEVVYGSSGEGIFPFFFWTGTDRGNQYLQGHWVSKRLNLPRSGGYYGARFLGWVKP